MLRIRGSAEAILVLLLEVTDKSNECASYLMMNSLLLTGQLALSSQATLESPQKEALTTCSLKCGVLFPAAACLSGYRDAFRCYIAVLHIATNGNNLVWH